VYAGSKGKRKTRDLVRMNNYPEPFICRVEETSSKRKRLSNQPFMREDAAVLKVPFRSETIHRKIKTLVRTSGLNINLVLEHTPTLKDVLVRSALAPPGCSVTKAVAQAAIHSRFHEHHLEAKAKRIDKQWGQHMARYHASYNMQKPTAGQPPYIFKNAMILAVEKKESRRKLREAIEIRERKPEINMNSGWGIAPAWVE